MNFSIIPVMKTMAQFAFAIRCKHDDPSTGNATRTTSTSEDSALPTLLPGAP